MCREISAPDTRHAKMLIRKPVEFNDPYKVPRIFEAVYKKHSLNVTCFQVFSPQIFLSTALCESAGALKS